MPTSINYQQWVRTHIPEIYQQISSPTGKWRILKPEYGINKTGVPCIVRWKNRSPSTTHCYSYVPTPYTRAAEKLEWDCMQECQRASRYFSWWVSPKIPFASGTKEAIICGFYVNHAPTFYVNSENKIQIDNTKWVNKPHDCLGYTAAAHSLIIKENRDLKTTARQYVTWKILRGPIRI